MKKNLQLKSLTVLLFCCLVQTTALIGQPSEWQSAASGSFANNVTGTTIWNKKVLGTWTPQPGDPTTPPRPSGGSNVTIQTGHTITLAATTSILNLTIEPGGTLTSIGAFALRVGASATGGATDNVVSIINNGNLGSATAGSTDGLVLEMSPNCKTLTLEGTGATRVSRFRTLHPNLNVPATFNVNQSIDLGITGNYAFTAYYVAGTVTNTGTENIVVNLSANKTIKILSTTSYFHAGVSNTPATAPQGTVTYNIGGILDLSATTSGGFQSSSQTGAATPGPASLNLNIKSGGIMKLGSVFSAYKGANTGSVNMTIESGGLVDGTALTANITNNSSTLGTGYTWFVTQGTGVLKLPVAATSQTFPVGPDATHYNPVTMNNGGGTVYSVNVATGNTPAGLPDVTKALNRTWTVSPAGTADINFGFNTGEGNGSCVLTDPMALFNSSGGAWTSLGTGTPSVPSSGATNYQVGFTGVAFAGTIFNLSNIVAIPVELMSFKANAKGNVNVLDWTTASERNNRGFDVERSVNGIDFIKLGTVKGKGNAAVVNNYTFTDNEAPLSNAYYRLRQIDMDGRATVSKTVTVARNGSGKARIVKTYPSVTSDYLTLELTANGNTTLTVSDLMGRTLSTLALGDNNGSMIQRLDVSQLATGLYFITLQSGGTRLTEKFEKY
jgi:hypothetical protein